MAHPSPSFTAGFSGLTLGLFKRRVGRWGLAGCLRRFLGLTLQLLDLFLESVDFLFQGLDVILDDRRSPVLGHLRNGPRPGRRLGCELS